MAEEKKLNIFNESANDENVQELIKNANKVSDDIATEAAKRIAEKRKEKLTQELIEVVQKNEYTIMSTVLQVRRSNRINQRLKTYLKELSALANAIKDGSKSTQAWDKESRELKKQLDKDLIQIGDEIDESQKDLDEIFPNSWSYRWNSLIPQVNRK